MMQLRKNMLLGVFLVLQWRLFCSDSVPRVPCDSSETTVTCRLAEADLQGVQTISLDVLAERTVTIQLDKSPGSYAPCFWAQRETGDMLPFQSFIKGTDGVYPAVCGNGNSNYSVNISVHVVPPQKPPSVPQLTITVDKFAPKFRCVSKGNPKPTISWYNNNEKISQHVTEETNTEIDTTGSILNGFEYQNSNTKCCAKNSQGEECSLVYHYELGKPLQEDEAPLIPLSPGQTLSLGCKKRKKGKNDPRVKWYFNNTELSGGTAYNFYDEIEYFCHKSVSVHDSGEYICKCEDNQTKAVKVLVHDEDLIDVLELQKNFRIPAREKANFCFQAQVLSHPRAQCHWVTPNGTQVQCQETQYFWGKSIFKLCSPEPGQYQIHLRTGQAFVTRNLSLCVTDIPKFTIVQDLDQVTCKTISSPPHTLSWKICPADTNCSDSAMWKTTNVDLTEFPDSGQFCQKKIVILKAVQDVNNNIVKCCLTYPDGSFCSDKIEIKMPSMVSMVTTVMCCILVIALLVVSLTLVHFSCKKKPGYESQLQMIQMVGPSDNDYVYIDFKDFKYDQSWEFPRKNLEFGKKLGSGAFGMVIQATAYGLSRPGVSMQVAVKMLKDKHQTVEKEALMSELKMLIHIGTHINIVNLLGACTGTGPTYLIFQYCCYGDLLNYLKNKRENFCKSLADALNKDRFSGIYQNNQRKRNPSEFVQSDDISYMHMSPVSKECEGLVSITSTDVNDEVFEIEDEDLQTLTYNDLLSFSCQVARGMDFLSSKNCIHRDLAARNVLVTRGRLMKIGDFGLARDVENDSNYVVRGNACLPVKWMAPESIFKGVYTMQSDVWAYGILLWEIFSLGVTPYPGVKVDNVFYSMIDRGFHMERPFYADQSVYEVMGRCWSLEPNHRPCFSKLVTFMEYQLSDVEEQVYYNMGGQKSSESPYKNMTVISEPEETEKEAGTCQSSPMDSTCKTEMTEEDMVQTHEDEETETYF